MRLGRGCVAAAFVALAVTQISPASDQAIADQPAAAAAPRNHYRFRVERIGKGEVEFRGELTVDGRHRTLDQEMTPFEFECEAATDLSGRIETVDPDRMVRMKVFLVHSGGTRQRVGKVRGSPIDFRWLSKDGGAQRVTFAYVTK